MRRAVGLAVVASMVAGCSLEPVYERPAAAVPESWPSGDSYAVQQPVPDVPSIGYRDLFHDPKLQSLIGRAVANNQDVRRALASVAAARGQYQAQRGLIFPQVVAEGSARSDQAGGFPFGSGARATTYGIDVGLSSFEIDLFGRLRSLSDAALQTYLSTDAAASSIRLTLVAQVATTYLTIATDRSLLGIARDTEGSASRSVELTRARLSGGVAPRADVRQAETVLAQARADLANQTTLVAQDRNALQLLIGAAVDDSDLPASIESVDGLLDELPPGLDSRVLLRRPDVVQAEFQLKAADGQIGAARAAFFPTVSLTALLGFASGNLASLFTHQGLSSTIEPAVVLPIFDGGVRQGNLDVANAQRDAALAAYQKAIQSAFNDVANALARRGTIDEQFQAQQELEAAARDSFYLADARYREGIDPFLNSLDAQRTLYTARRALASIRLTRADNLVELYRVLGGSTN